MKGRIRLFVVASLLSVLCYITIYFLNIVTWRLTERPMSNPKSGNSCHIPVLDPFDPSIAKYIGKSSPFHCDAIQSSFSYLDENGYIWLNETQVEAHNCTGDLSCTWRGIERAKTYGTTDYDFEYSQTSKITSDNSVHFPDYDVAEVNCTVGSTRIYHQVHAHPQIIDRAISPTDEEHLSVILFVVESASASAVRRRLPRTREYLETVMGTKFMNGYNKVGENSFPNLIPILTGKRVEASQPDMPKEEEKTRFGRHDSWDIIWKHFAANGYATAFIEDQPDWGLFHYNRGGFAAKPVDHFLMPYFLTKLSSPFKANSSKYCYGNEPEYAQQSDLSKRVVMHYNGKRHFQYLFFCEVSHNWELDLAKADDVFHDYFSELYSGGYLNHTAIFFLGDHGTRYGPIRWTKVGRLESQMPALGIYLPTWFYRKHTNIDVAMSINERRLATPFDVHQTLLNLATSNFSSPQLPHGTRGLNLFREIPESRDCTIAGIPDSFCSCFADVQLDKTSPQAQAAASEFVAELNRKIAPVNSSCAELTLFELRRAEMYETSRIPVPGESIPDGLTDRVTVIRLQIIVSPSNAGFEAGIHVDSLGRQSIPNPISRINAYTAQSHCVKGVIYSSFCFCKDLIHK